MILRHLVQYYEKNIDFLPPFGYQYQEISFILILDQEGDLLDIQDTRNRLGEGEKMLVPQSVKRSGTGATPNCLWDNLKYVFGIGQYQNSKQKKALEEKKLSFLNNVKKLALVLKDNEEVLAVIRFLESDFLEKLEKHPIWREIEKLNAYISFSLKDYTHLVCQSDSVRRALAQFSKATTKEKTSFCLLTGEKGAISRLHPTIQGVYGAQGSGASLISYNLESVESFRKVQGYNAPISELAAFAYSTALNHLLESSQKIAFHEAMTVLFWSEKKSFFENSFAAFLKLSSKDSSLLTLSNFEPSDEDSLPFYVHALSPNGARLSVRFSWEGSIGEVKKQINKHFEDLRLVNFSYEQKLYSIYSLLHAVSPCDDVKYVPPNLAGEFLCSLLNGMSYPHSLLPALLRRLFDENGISHKRISLLKAFMNRSSNPLKIPPSLDLLNENTGYLLGRLLAIFEIISKKTIKKRQISTVSSFYKIASILPRKIFPRLLELCAIHMRSLTSEYLEYFQNITNSIMSSLQEFPEKLSLIDQGAFAIGYYQQIQNIFLETKIDE